MALISPPAYVAVGHRDRNRDDDSDRAPYEPEQTGDIYVDPFGPSPYYDPYYDPYYVPPPLLPPIVLGGPRRRFRRRHRHGRFGRFRGQMPNENNDDEFDERPFESTDCGYDQNQYADEGEGDPAGGADDDDEQGGEEFGDRDDMQSQASAHSKYLKDCAAHPLAQKDHKFEKLLCKACSGHTILRDGQPFEQFHADSCAVLKTAAAAAAATVKAEKKEKNIGCAECGGKGHHHHVVVVPPPEVVDCTPPPPACPKPACPKPTVIQLQPQEEEECESETSTDDECEEEVEEEVCDKKAGTVVEVYLSDESSLGKKLLEAHTTNKPVRALFDKTIFSKDGKSAMKVKCAVTTAVADASGRTNFTLGLTPVSTGSKPAPTISANLWTVDMKNGDKSKRIRMNMDAAREFYAAGVQKEVLASVVSHVENALLNAKK